MVRRTENLIRLSQEDKDLLWEVSKVYKLSLSDTVAKLLNEHANSEEFKFIVRSTTTGVK